MQQALNKLEGTPVQESKSLLAESTKNPAGKPAAAAKASGAAAKPAAAPKPASAPQ